MKKIIFLSLFVLLLCSLLFSCQPELSEEDITKFYLTALGNYQNQKYDESLEYLALIHKYDPNFFQASFLEGKVLFFTGDIDKAQNMFKNLFKKYPEFIEAKIWYIRTLIIKGDYVIARDLLEKEMSFNQTDWRIFYLYSLLEERQGNIDKKIVMLNRAEMVLADSVKVYLELSDIWNMLDLQSRASLYNEKANILSETNASLHMLGDYINKTSKKDK